MTASLAEFRLPEFLCTAIFAAARDSVRGLRARPPHGLTIGGEDNPYLRRWFITPRGEGPAVCLHQFLRDDDDRALHDHPWASIGIILAGGYREMTPEGEQLRQVGDVIYRLPEQRHRVVLHRDDAGRPKPAWTLFLTGTRVRDWGFWCPGAGGGERFVRWQDFTAGEHGERVGRGCEAAGKEGGWCVSI